MTITVKNLIKELEKIQNKYLEVYVCHKDDGYKRSQIDYINEKDKAVLIFTTETT